MKAVEAMEFNIVTPAHGPVSGKPDIAKARQYVEELRDAVAEGIGAGQGLAELQERIVMEDYSDWYGYDWVPRNIEGMYNILSGRRLR